MKLPQLEGRQVDPEVMARMENKLRFETWLVRDVGFRFQFADQARFKNRSDAYVIIQNGDHLINWWEFRGIQTPESLRIAIAAAHGVAQGSSSIASELLLPSVLGGGLFYVPQHLTLGDLVEIEGETCRELLNQISRPAGLALPMEVSGSRRIYVGLDSLLIRRTVTEAQTPQGAWVTTIDYSPSFDSEIDPEIFDTASWATRAPIGQ